MINASKSNSGPKYKDKPCLDHQTCTRVTCTSPRRFLAMTSACLGSPKPNSGFKVVLVQAGWSLKLHKCHGHPLECMSRSPSCSDAPTSCMPCRRCGPEMVAFWGVCPWPKYRRNLRKRHSPTEILWPGSRGGQTVIYIHSPTELSWPEPRREQAGRYDHFPTVLSWTEPQRG